MPEDRPPSRFGELPDQTEDPVVWDPALRKFVPRDARPAEAAPVRDPRRFYVGVPDERQRSGAPPPRVAPPGSPSAPSPAPPPAPPSPVGVPAPERSRRWPKLRRR